MKKKFLAAFLALCLVFSLMPMTTLADFADTEGHWGQDAIDRWASVGVLNGKGENNFDPNGSMTRAEFAQMLCNMMGYTKKAENTFTDIPDDAWYADAMLKLVEAGVISGVGDGLAAPNAPITREMAAVMLCRAFNIKTSSASLGFADAGSVSSWARDSVAALSELGMMNGVGDNNVAPQLNINRASVATLIDNMVAEYVTEDKTITGEVNGIILVAGDATVKFEDATVNAPIIVAPAAKGADVELTGETKAEDVVVAAEGAAVTVGKDATAETVTVAAEKAEVKVEGTVDTVAVTAENAKVNVAGTVGTVSTEAANTTVAVSGTVDTIEVAEGADKTEITTTSTAKIDSVTTAAEDVKVSGSGTVNSVTAEGGSADVTTKGTEVKNEGADKVTAGDKEVASGESQTVPSTSGGGAGGGGGSTSSTQTKKAVKTYVKNDNSVSYSITIKDNGTKLDDAGDGKVIVGHKVTIEIDCTNVVTVVAYTGSNTQENILTQVGTVSGGKRTYEFTMPNNDVKLTIEIGTACYGGESGDTGKDTLSTCPGGDSTSVGSGFLETCPGGESSATGGGSSTGGGGETTPSGDTCPGGENNGTGAGSTTTPASGGSGEGIEA